MSEGRTTRRVTPEERRVTETLALAWEKGYAAGWRDGVHDATDDEPVKSGRNPYKYDND